MTPEAAALEHVRRMVTLAERRLELASSYEAFAALAPRIHPVALQDGLDCMRAASQAFRAALELQSIEAIQTAEFLLGAAVDQLDAIILRATAGASTTLH